MPTRYLKPGICDSETIDKCSPLAEVLFYRLLVNVDDFGRMDARPVLVKSKCFPIKETITTKQTDGLLKELCKVGLIYLYESQGKLYLQMSKWDNIPRAKESKFPAPDGSCIQMYTNVNIVHTNLPETETETGTGTKTETENRNMATPLPDWLPTDLWKDYLQARKALKAPMTERAKQLAIKKLDELMKQGYPPKDVLSQSIYNGWKGLFPLKTEKESWHDKRAREAKELIYGKPKDERVLDGEAEILDWPPV